MIRFDTVFIWTVFILNRMAISMVTYSDKILEAESTLQDIQLSRQLFKERGDINNMFKTSVSPDPNAFSNLKRQRLGYGGEEFLYQRGGYQPLESQSLNGYPSTPLKRLRDGTMMDGASLSLGPPIEMESPMTAMENLEGSKGEPRMARKPPTGHQNPRLSSSQRPIYSNYKDPAAYLVPNDSGLEQLDSRRVSSNPYGDRLVQGTPSTSSTRQDSQVRAAKIDIRNFQLHTPDRMFSAAAAHYTRDLIEALSRRYPTSSERYVYPSWEVGKLIWTSERLLPFVYFVVSCNPRIKIWNKIKGLTVLILRNYHKSSVDTKNLWNEQKHARFLLWHTEVIYHTALLEPMIESSSVSLAIPRLSTLTRTFLLINDDSAFMKFRPSANRRAMLEKYVSVTFEGDYQAGYPLTRHNQKAYVPTLENWNKKSKEIMDMGKGMVWPKIPNGGWDQTEPILFMNGNVQHDTILKKNLKLKFFTHWEADLQNMLQSIKASQPTNLALPNLSLKRICKGLNKYLNGKFEKTRSKTNVDNTPIEYQVTFFTRFLHQEMNDEIFERFWSHYDALKPA